MLIPRCTRISGLIPRALTIKPVRHDIVDQSGPTAGAVRPSRLALRGFRAAADTVRGQLISRNGNRMKRFEEVLSLLPQGYVFDGELVVLDDAGRPLFNKLLFGDHRPTYVAFDLLFADGVDLRPLPLKDRQARACPNRQPRRGLDPTHQRCRGRRPRALPRCRRSRPRGHRRQETCRPLQPETNPLAHDPEPRLI